MRRLIVSSVWMLAAGCGSTTLINPEVETIEVTIAQSPTSLPIDFDQANPLQFTLNLRVRDGLGNTVTNYDPHFKKWVHLALVPEGTIVSVTNPLDATATFGSEVRIDNGEVDNLVVSTIGAYSTSNFTATDIGYVPCLKNPVSQCQCADGIDNDDNGFADYPLDPGCAFINDDYEGPASEISGISVPIPFATPTIYDIQFPAVSPFDAQSVAILTTPPTHQLVVTSVSSSGMYVTDIDETRGANGVGANSIFVYNFSAPFGVRECDTLSMLSGNISIFYGDTQLGTPGWTDVPWENESISGLCPIPNFVSMTDVIANNATIMPQYQSELIEVDNPIIGANFGSGLVPLDNNNPVPEPGQSNCDLNGDGIVGFSTSKPGYDATEAACENACDADANCSEWNNWLQYGQVKIKFGPTNGLLFFDPSNLQQFAMADWVSPDSTTPKIAQLRGISVRFVGPKPNYQIQPRCNDDFVAVGADPSTILDAQHACIFPRVGLSGTSGN